MNDATVIVFDRNSPAREMAETSGNEKVPRCSG
jgi:hypothetical protein